MRSQIAALAVAIAALATAPRALAAPAGGAPGSAAPKAAATAVPPGLAVVTVDRRQVAIVDLTGDEDATAAARGLAERLVRHSSLAPLSDPAAAAALLGPLREEDQLALEGAKRALAEANDALARFELAVAAARAAAGQIELHDVDPTPTSIALYADLAFVHGLAKLADSDGPAARSSFLLTQRLDPDRVLDPARYLPDVIAAYRQARRGGGGRMQIQVRGQGTVSIDGTEVGAAPVTVEVATGPHVVQLTGPSRLARGARIEVTPTSSTVVTVPEARAAAAVVLGRARRAVATGRDDAARATAMAELARLINVGDAILVRRGPAGLTAQVWRDRAPGAGPIHAMQSALLAGDLLAELAPDTIVSPSLPTVPRTAEPKRWYQKRWVQASMVTGAVAMLTAAVVLGTVDFDEGTVSINPDPSF
ncbi:MAG: PEGA domain-containing protein [Myxococcales bacterium]|nr:PEGA domain-containing protein [Myxococcales bacterium]